MLFLLLYFRLLKHLFSHFAFLAVIAAPQVTMSVLNKLDTSYNVVIWVLYVVIMNVTDDIDVVVLA